MSICKIGNHLKIKLNHSSPSPVNGTPFHKVSVEIIEMASAYHIDGFSFHRTGDRINAFASFAYGLGWLDAGIFTGLVNAHDNNITQPDILTGLDERLSERLTEKTTRYERMLSKALQSIRPYPDKSSPAFYAACDIIKKTEDEYKKGDKYLKNAAFWNSLWHYSYGYGWLDAGIRAGLIEVTENRQLFTID